MFGFMIFVSSQGKREGGDHRHEGGKVLEFHWISFPDWGFGLLKIYSALADPIMGGRTGLAKPKKTSVVFEAKRVETASSGTCWKSASVWSQLLATQTFPAGSAASPVTVCRPPM
jgi:hypothetical protein